MGVLYVAFVLVCGYIYTTTYAPARYRHKRSTGWTSYFEVAKYGFIAAMAATVVTVLLDFFDVPSNLLASANLTMPEVAGKLHEYSSGAINRTEFAIALITLALAYSGGHFQNRKFKKPRTRFTALRQLCKNEEVESLFLEAAATLTFVSVTLDTRKCYIGIVLDVPVEETSLDSLAIIPFYSGYRDETTLDLKITRSYYQHYRKAGLYGENPDYKKLFFYRVVLPANRIVACSLFSQSVYKSLGDQSPKPRFRLPRTGKKTLGL